MGLFAKGYTSKTNDELAADTKNRSDKWDRERAQDLVDAKKHNPDLRRNADIRKR